MTDSAEMYLAYNGLALPRQQAIVWTYDGYFTDAHMPHSASMSWIYP